MSGQPATRGLMLVKLESTYGTDPTPDNTDALIIEAGEPFQIEAEKLERTSLKTDPINSPHVMGARAWKIAFQTEAKNGGTAGTPAKLGRLLQMAGLKETDAAGDDTYTQDITDAKSGTLWFYDGTRLKEANGVRFGKATISAKTGERTMAAFEGMGLYVADTDASIVATPTIETTEALVFQGGTFTFNAFSFVVSAFELSLETGLASRKSFAAATGYVGFNHTKYAWKGKATVEAESVADQAIIANLLSNDNAVLDMTIGSTSGNKIDIDAPRCRIASVAEGNEGGIRTWEVEFDCYDSADGTFNDAVSIKLY